MTTEHILDTHSETYDQKFERLRVEGARELSRRYAEAATIPDDQWVPCSPEWLAAGGDCDTAPRRHGSNASVSHEHPAARPSGDRRP